VAVRSLDAGTGRYVEVEDGGYVLYATHPQGGGNFDLLVEHRGFVADFVATAELQDADGNVTTLSHRVLPNLDGGACASGAFDFLVWLSDSMLAAPSDPISLSVRIADDADTAAFEVGSVVLQAY
jgi:hypothetical protein